MDFIIICNKKRKKISSRRLYCVEPVHRWAFGNLETKNLCITRNICIYTSQREKKNVLNKISNFSNEDVKHFISEIVFNAPCKDCFNCVLNSKMTNTL